jgi:hypothetical protein
MTGIEAKPAARGTKSETVAQGQKKAPFSAPSAQVRFASGSIRTADIAPEVFSATLTEVHESAHRASTLRTHLAALGVSPGDFAPLHQDASQLLQDTRAIGVSSAE